MSNSTNPSLYSLMEKVIDDKTLTQKEKISLINELRKNNPTTTDRWAPRTAIYFLGTVVLATILCIALSGTETSEGLIAIGSAAVGGLAGLISQTPQTTKTDSTTD